MCGDDLTLSRFHVPGDFFYYFSHNFKQATTTHYLTTLSISHQILHTPTTMDAKNTLNWAITSAAPCRSLIQNSPLLHSFSIFSTRLDCICIRRSNTWILNLISSSSWPISIPEPRSTSSILRIWQNIYPDHPSGFRTLI